MEARPRSANGKVIPRGRGFSPAGGGPRDTLHVQRVMNAKFPPGLSASVAAFPSDPLGRFEFHWQGCCPRQEHPPGAWGAAEHGQWPPPLLRTQQGALRGRGGGGQQSSAGDGRLEGAEGTGVLRGDACFDGTGGMTGSEERAPWWSCGHGGLSETGTSGEPQELGRIAPRTSRGGSPAPSRTGGGGGGGSVSSLRPRRKEAVGGSACEESRAGLGEVKGSGHGEKRPCGDAGRWGEGVLPPRSGRPGLLRAKAALPQANAASHPFTVQSVLLTCRSWGSRVRWHGPMRCWGAGAALPPRDTEGGWGEPWQRGHLWAGHGATPSLRVPGRGGGCACLACGTFPCHRAKQPGFRRGSGSLPGPVGAGQGTEMCAWVVIEGSTGSC